MSGLATAVIGSAVIGGIANNQKNQAAKGAVNAQVEGNNAAIAEGARQFDKLQSVLAPYTQAGEKSLGGLLDIFGLNGADKQASAIDAIKSGPEFAALTKTGEEAILANASATGVLRGGNTQDALAKFRPSILSDLINQQVSRLGYLTNVGQASAAGVGNAAVATGANVGGIMQNSGQAIAQGALARGNNTAGFIGNIGQGAGILAGYYGGGISGNQLGKAILAGGF